MPRSIAFLGTLFAVLTVLSLSSTGARSDDSTARDKLTTATQLYLQREDLAKNDQVIALLGQAETEAQDADLKYRIIILESQALYWKAKHMNAGKDEKMATYDQAMKKTSFAFTQINPNYAEAYYFYAISLGEWAQVNGIIASLKRKKELMDHLQYAIDRTSIDGKPGETIDGYGPARALGRLYFKLPGFAGGSHNRAIDYLEKAYTNAPDFGLNVVYYAETLIDGSSDEKDTAREILDGLLAKDPLTVDLNRIPESKEEWARARQLRKDLGN